MLNQESEELLRLSQQHGLLISLLRAEAGVGTSTKG